MASSRSQAKSRGSSGALTKNFFVRVTDSEHRAFTQAAKDAGLKSAEWARRILRAAIKPPQPSVSDLHGLLASELVHDGTVAPYAGQPRQNAKIVGIGVSCDDDPDLKF